MNQLVFLEISAGDSHGHGSLPWWDDDSDTRVSASSHGSSSSIHHEAHEESSKEIIEMTVEMKHLLKLLSLHQKNLCTEIKILYFVSYFQDFKLK